MLSKKVFLAGEPNFSAPPVHAARADVRDHVESQEGDHRASYASDRGLQKRRQSKPVFREISGAAQFSTFSTASTRSRHRSSLAAVGATLVSAAFLNRSNRCMIETRGRQHSTPAQTRP